MLKIVTLTGADQSIKVSELADISKKYPYVEWGILFSQSKAGVPRYASYDWITELQALSGVNLAAHLCGKWVDDIMSGNFTFINDSLSSIFNRFQLNMGASRLQTAISSQSVLSAIKPCNKHVMFGGDYSGLNPECFKNNLQISPLFDASGGRGVKASRWPKPYIKETGDLVFCGYAGGLGPDNVEEELKNITEVCPGDYWIDMESSLRSRINGNDVFDLDKCVSVLEKVKPWM